eukprot:TRINITY_DN626_c0_g1_i9.p1 TRINITY_DN626_c0_g1~~TRINITY_DN626_c0_g1_i9.p1  ORF type:complete len:293 (-),score=98.39 TRINITY_DN626_c0_g1_i9:46-861(-)
MFRVAVIVLLGVVAAQDFITIIAIGSSSSQSAENVGTAVVKAVSKLNSTCEAGNEAEVQAKVEARKVVEAAATATAAGGIFINSTGSASGNATVVASSTATATAIAKAIAEAIATVANGPEVQSKIESIYTASKSVAAQIDIDGSLQGAGTLLAASAASATAFVSAVAEALASAAAKCENVNGTPVATVNVASNVTAFGVPAFADFTSTQSAGVATSIGDGFSLLRSNQGIARILNSTVGDALPPVGVANATRAADLVPAIFCQLGVSTSC